MMDQFLAQLINDAGGVDVTTVEIVDDNAKTHSPSVCQQQEQNDGEDEWNR